MNILILCIGNSEGGDDAVGPYIAEKIKDIQNEKIKVLNCGTTPENYTSIVKEHNPKNLIIIDAVDMNLEPGEIRIVPKEKLGVMTISTHGIPVSLLIDYLEQNVKNIIFIGIQPESMSGKITDSVKNSADTFINNILTKEIEKIDFKEEISKL